MGYNPLDLEYEKVINSIDTTDQDYGVGVIFDYYRRHGFPHYKIREDEKHQHMRKMQRFDTDTIFKDNKIVQTMHGLRLAWSYFPFFWEIRCGNAKYTPMEIYLNDDKLDPYGFYVTRSNWTIVEHPLSELNNGDITMKLSGSARPLIAHIDDYDENTVFFYMQESYENINGYNCKYFTELKFKKLKDE